MQRIWTDAGNRLQPIRVSKMTKRSDKDTSKLDPVGCYGLERTLLKLIRTERERL